MYHVDEYSEVPLKLQLYFKDVQGNDHLLSNATGFVYKYKSKDYLISNWHVFSGRDSYSGQAVSTKGFTPTFLTLYLPHKDGFTPRDEKFEIQLVDSEGNNKWLQHISGQQVDVAAIEIDLDLEKRETFPINKMPANNDMAAMIGMESFILGYPLGLSSAAHFPIWKRATIASEPELDALDKKLILVDSATLEGMSGAPVILRSIQVFMEKSSRNLVNSGDIHTSFLGVYSGRMTSGGEKTQIGLVWKTIVIDEILENPQLGDFEIPTN